MANLYDRVQESTTTTGTGTYALGGAVTGFRTFNSQAANGTVIRCVIEDGVGNYEVGDYTLGTNTLARTTIIESSNSNNAVSWNSGTKYIYSDATARDVLPDQTSNSGKFLVTDGTNPAWSNTVSSLTLSGGTANGVVYLNGSKQATSGSALTFDGVNLGLGVTPSAWSGVKAFELSGSSHIAFASSVCSFDANAYYVSGTGYIYKTTDYATQYQQNGGQHRWYTAPSGTAGTAITFTQAMTLDANGTFRVKGAGTAGSTDAFQVSGSAPASAVVVSAAGNLNALTITEASSPVVVQTDIGSGANEVPLNGYLGGLAYVDTAMVSVPASASAAGVMGQIAQDGSYLYVCTAANTWKRVAIATW